MALPPSPPIPIPPSPSPPPKKEAKKEGSGSEEKLPYIPDDLIFSRILSFVSFDNLAKLRPVCKSWCSFISSSPYSSGLIFPACNSRGQFVFLPTLRGVGPPDVRPAFLSIIFSGKKYRYCVELVASTDGLLCLRTNGCIYVCNPSTKEGHVLRLREIPSHPEVALWLSSIGLAYDSSKSFPVAKYKLVRPWSHYYKEEEEEEIFGRLVFGFDIFSSETKEWDKSYNKFCIVEKDERDCFNLECLVCQPNGAFKSMYAGGVLYWDCYRFLMHFDPENGYGGTVTLPINHEDDYATDDYQQMGEFKGHVSYSKVSQTRGRIRLWILHLQDATTHETWELLHQVRFDPSVLRTAFGFGQDNIIGRFSVIPLPYGDDGTRFFMRVSLVGEDHDDVLCYDLNSGKWNKFCTLSHSTYNRWPSNRHSFFYRSTMASLPKLGNSP